MEKSRPVVILSAAITLDGKIATRTGDSDISSKRDKIRLHKLRSSVDAILVGGNTVKRDNPLLTVRYINSQNPVRIILDSKGVIPLSSKIIKTCDKVPTIIAVSKKISKKNLTKLKKRNLEIILVGKTTVDIRKLLQKLSKYKIKKLLLEGGGKTNWEFVRKRLVDEVIVTVSPNIVGGNKAITLVEGQGFSRIHNSFKLRLKKVKRLGNELILHYTNL